MNKAQLVDAVREVTGQSRRATEETVDAMLKVMVHTVASGEPLRVTGLGALEPYIAPARNARNPQTGGTVRVPDKIRVRFKPADRFLAYANGDTPLPPTAAETDIKAPKGAA